MTGVLAIVVNYHELEHTRACVAALRASEHPLDVLVVDNGSGLEEVTALGEIVDVVQAEDNLGYAGGNNVGIREAMRREVGAVWLVNPDSRPRGDALGHMVRVLDDDEVGVVGSRIVDEATGRVQSEGGRIDWDRGGASVLLHRGRRPRWRRRPRSVDFVQGASMLVRCDVFEHAGMLPEEYFMYFEETHFCNAAAGSGWKVMVAPRSVVVHHSARSFGLPSNTYVYYFTRNRILFGRRHTDASADAIVGDLAQFLGGWRRRVQRLDPSRLGRFDELVAAAVEDGRQGRTGRRPGITD